MAVFTRLSGVIAARFNALLDHIEDPDQMLAQLVRAMEEDLALARQQAARALAVERGLQRELQQHRQAAQHWEEQARLALAHGREDLARRALAAKIEQDDLVRALQPQHAEAVTVSAEVKAALHAVELRLGEVRRRQRLLQARQQVARVRVAALHLGGATQFEQAEQRLNDATDELLGQLELSGFDRELEVELGQLQVHKRIEEELRRIKDTGERPEP